MNDIISNAIYNKFAGKWQDQLRNRNIGLLGFATDKNGNAIYDGGKLVPAYDPSQKTKEQMVNKSYAATNKKSVALKKALGLNLNEEEKEVYADIQNKKIQAARQTTTKAREGASLIAKFTKPLFKPGASLIANMFAMPAHNTNEYIQTALETEKKADSIATDQAKTIERFVSVPATVIDFAAEKTAIEMSQDTF